MSEYLTPSEAAELLQVSQKTVRRLSRDQIHPLPCLHITKRIPRFRRSDLIRWMSERRDKYVKESEKPIR